MSEAIIVFLLATAVVVALVVLVRLLAGAVRRALARRRLMRDTLPEDWWPRFEADLRAYTSRPWASARDRELRR